MIVTKLALPRRTFLRGIGATVALPLLDAMIPSLTAVAKTPASAERLRRLGYVYMPMGCDVTRWTPPGGEMLDELSPTLSPLAPVKAACHDHHQHGVAECVSGHARDFQRGVLERGQGEAHRKLGLLSRHDSRPDRGPANRPEHAAAVAGNVDGLAGHRRPVRQRLRLRLSEQSFLVVADDAAAGRSASANRVRESVRRRRQPGRSPRRAAQRKPACSIRSPKKSRACKTRSAPAIASASANIWKRSAKSSAAFSRPRPNAQENPLPDLDRPVGVPAAYADHARLMFDLQMLALQGDITRVITFQLARETSNRTYPEIGVSDPHHPLTHHGNDPEKIATRGEDQSSFTSRCSPSSSQKLQATPEGDGSLLDHSLYLVRQRHGQSQRPRPRQPADHRRRRRRRAVCAAAGTSATTSPRRWPTCT